MEEASVEEQLRAVMEFYVKSYFDANKEKFFEFARKMNTYGLDPDIVESKAEDYLKDIIEEASEKFHNVAYVILQAMTKMEEGKIREFELLFIDLVKRTLLKNAEQNPSIIVIADSRVGSEEN